MQETPETLEILETGEVLPLAAWKRVWLRWISTEDHPLDRTPPTRVAPTCANHPLAECLQAVAEEDIPWALGQDDRDQIVDIQTQMDLCQAPRGVIQCPSASRQQSIHLSLPTLNPIIQVAQWAK